MKRVSLFAIAAWLGVWASPGRTDSQLDWIGQADGRRSFQVAMAPQADTLAKPAETPRVPDRLKGARLNELYEKGRQLYDAGDLAGARAAFEEMLLIDPEDLRARTYLDNTREEWQRYQAQQRGAEEEREREEMGEERLQTPITLEAKRPMPLNEFVNILSFASGINFSIASGLEANVSNAKFVDIPLSDVLDTVLGPMGLKWSQKGGVVSITPALETRTFRLSSSQVAKVKALYEDQELQRVLWGAEGKPQLQGENVFLDERNFVLVATDSRPRLDKLGSLLSDLERAIAPALVTRFYRIQGGYGPKIKALVDSLIKTDTDSPLNLERRVYFEGNDMIVRETPERLARIEELLRNQGFIEELVSDKLQIAAFSLIPRQALSESDEYAREYLRAVGDSIVEQLKTFLYHKTGIEEAAKQGRKMWFDPNTLTLVLTDMPENIAAVDDFLGSLPELEPKERFKVVFLKHALSEDMASELQDLLGISPVGAEAEALGGLSVTKTLRREDEFTWRDLTVVVRRITQGGDIFDELSDEAELVLRVKGGQQASNQTVRELDVPVYIQDGVGGEYELYADEIRPTGMPGDGRVRLVITYNPLGTNQLRY